jgi:abortive infection bacteriophage resistance protein
MPSQGIGKEPILMEYPKEALRFEDQADRLLERGLAADRGELISRLQAVSYYRLAGYLHPFRLRDEQDKALDRFVEGTNLETVWRRYCFDRRLRVLVLDAIERVEVSVRTKLIFHFAHANGPFGYCDDANLPKLSIGDYLEWRTALQEETDRSKETFKKHFFDKYGDHHRNLPVWMLAELMSMGSLLTFFKGVEPDLKRRVAEEYGLPDEVTMSWLRSLNAARNICAHHSRFWNRVLGYPPMLPNPRKFPDWHGENKLPTDRCGIILMICRHMLRMISPSSRWHERVEDLFKEYSDVPRSSMGLSETWTNHPIWNPISKS